MVEEKCKRGEKDDEEKSRRAVKETGMLLNGCRWEIPTSGKEFPMEVGEGNWEKGSKRGNLGGRKE